MFDESSPSPGASALVQITPADPHWQPILHVSNQVVLYNPTSHALTIHSSNSPQPIRLCPYCSRPLASDAHLGKNDIDMDEDVFENASKGSRVPNYFQLLEVANETASRPGTPPYRVADDIHARNGESLKPGSMAEGYFNAFFREEARLGMGANGSVYLCQVRLLIYLKTYLTRLGAMIATRTRFVLTPRYILASPLQTADHLENVFLARLKWKSPCVLMQWAEGGSLDDFIDARLGRPTQLPYLHPDTPSGPSTPSSTPPPDVHSRSARIRAFRQMQHASPEEKERIRERLGVNGGVNRGNNLKAVHLLSAEEVKGLFSDIVEGLGFLHDKSILHLDLKPGNVLLTWDEGKLIPRAMLSDFGTSRDMINNSRTRSGNTGTLEYTSPESLPSPFTGLLQQIDSKSDMWSLGMILHKLLFFKLPYRWAANGDKDETLPDGSRPTNVNGADRENEMDWLEREVLRYKGFKSTKDLETAFASRRLPKAYLILLESLLNVVPSSRPSCERVFGSHSQWQESTRGRDTGGSSLIPMLRRKAHSRSPPSLARPRSSNGTPTRGEYLNDGVTGGHDARLVEAETEVHEEEEDWEEERKALLGLPAPAPGSMAERWGWVLAVTSGLRGSFGWDWRKLVFGNEVHGSGRGFRVLRPVPVPAGQRAVAGGAGRRDALVLRTIKSCILVAKVASLFYLAPDTVLRRCVLAFLLALAVADTILEGVRISAALGLVHFVVLWSCTEFGIWGGVQL
ncbi:hypothetical protein EW146_g8898 [Bondarzewia mesenterica]|uniref:Protein kinase domain-containing protein n=1 Tax=Bondarzewia mesenterica TaxID=1095465 RepID=A0A4V3XD82_9AGAM|nr:hypothetical protein EW146_g8898 [Bondarzewia mesenterica]